MGVGKFNVLFMLLILVLGQYIMFTPISSSANYDFVEPAELVEYRETLVLTNATELVAALSNMFTLGLVETQVADLSEELESMYLQLFPDGTFHELEPFLLKINDELNLNLTINNIRMFENGFWSEVERAKEQLVKSLGQDVLVPATLISMPVREESAPYLHGRSLIAVILVDDASWRVGWNWISKGVLRLKIGAAMKYLEAKAPKEAKTSFSGRIYHTSVSSVIDSNAWPPTVTWMDEAVRNLGYDDVHDMARRLKDESGVDDVVLVFVPHKSSIRYLGYALPAPYWGYGERVCALFFLIDLFGIGIPNPFSVYVHEILHLFGAVDEYYFPGQQGPPEPWMAYPPLGELWPNKGWPFSVCVMCDAFLFWFRMCTWTRGQIGWNDYDGDGILDPVDPDPRNPYRPWEYVFDIPANGSYEVEVDVNLTDVTVVGDFAPLVWTLTYPQPYVNFFVLDPNGDIIIQAFETLNYSFSFNATIAGAYRFRFENPTDTPIYSMCLRLALIVTLPVELVELEPLRIFSVNLTMCDEGGRPLGGIPVSVISTAGYSALQLTNLNGELNLWLPEGKYSVKATYRNSTILNVKINIDSNYSKIFYVFLPVEPPPVARFKVSDLMISPPQVEVGGKVTISIKVENIGKAKGTYTLVLKINGTVEATKNVTLAEGEFTTVTFEVVKGVPGTYNVEVDELTGTLVVRALRPAEFKVDLSISPSEVKKGEAVTITVKVTNMGELEGAYTVTLKVDGQVEAAKEVMLTAGASTLVTFTTTKGVAETYQVEVNGQTGTFTVEEVAEVPSPPTPIEAWLPYVGAAIVAVVAILAIAAFLIKEGGNG